MTMTSSRQPRRVSEIISFVCIDYYQNSSRVVEEVVASCVCFLFV